MAHPDDLNTLTTRDRRTVGQSAASTTPALTILYHPDVTRIGERVALPPLAVAGGQVAVSRVEPLFGPPRGGSARGLQTPFISRQPIHLLAEPSGGVVISRDGTKTSVRVGESRVMDQFMVPGPAVDLGVVLTVASDVVLLLHRVRADRAPDAPDHGLVGASDALNEVRDRIDLVAGSDAPVLLRGETGSGKELVAKAIHAASARSRGPYVILNLAAVPGQLAASELFGHIEGAFSGAKGKREGYFARADRGVLFLDEVGETPSDVQPLLLRALESGEIQPVGASKVAHVDVRLVSATDADLETMVTAGAFRAPLLYRLANHEIRLPPLRQRKDDIGRLLRHFLLDELTRQGRAQVLQRPLTDPPWLPGPLVARLADHPWPGNVRQLRNVARYLASLREDPTVDDPHLERLLQGPTPERTRPGVPPGGYATGPAPAAPHTQPRFQRPAASGASPSSVTEDQLEAVMRDHDYRLGPAAGVLGMSRPSLNALVDKHPLLRRARSLTAEEIAACAAEHGDDIDKMWRALRVSKRGLTLRMGELGLT